MSVSQELFQQAARVIPGGVNSPVRACKSVQCEPLFIASLQDDVLKSDDKALTDDR